MNRLRTNIAFILLSGFCICILSAKEPEYPLAELIHNTKPKEDIEKLLSKQKSYSELWGELFDIKHLCNLEINNKLLHVIESKYFLARGTQVSTLFITNNVFQIKQRIAFSEDETPITCSENNLFAINKEQKIDVYNFTLDKNEVTYKTFPLEKNPNSSFSQISYFCNLIIEGEKYPVIEKREGILNDVENHSNSLIVLSPQMEILHSIPFKDMTPINCLYSQLFGFKEKTKDSAYVEGNLYLFSNKGKDIGIGSIQPKDIPPLRLEQ